jgi:hypothetical protein
VKKGSTLLLLISILSCVQAQTPQNSEESFRNYFVKNINDLDRIEGIWCVLTTEENYHFDSLYTVQIAPKPDTIAIINREGKYRSLFMSGEPYNLDFITTEVKGVYLFRNYFVKTDQFSKPQAVICKAGEMEFTYDYPQEYLLTLTGQAYKGSTRVTNIVKWKKLFPVN